MPHALLPEAVGWRIAGAKSAFALGECFAVWQQGKTIPYTPELRVRQGTVMTTRVCGG